MDRQQNAWAKTGAAVQNGKQTERQSVGRKEGFDRKRGRFYQAGLTGVFGGLGVPGTGKTTLILEKIWCARFVLIYNTAGDFGGGPRQKPLPGFHFVFDICTLGDWLLKAKAEKWEQVRICFTPLRYGRDPVEVFAAVCRMVADFGDCVFFVDEIWNFQTSSSSPHQLRELMLQWRHYGISLAWTAQIPQKVDKTLLTVSTELYVGRLNLENDLEAVRRNGRIPEDALRIIPTLPDWSFVHRFEDGRYQVERP